MLRAQTRGSSEFHEVFVKKIDFVDLRAQTQAKPCAGVRLRLEFMRGPKP
jgi:hypothetical protein